MAKVIIEHQEDFESRPDENYHTFMSGNAQSSQGILGMNPILLIAIAGGFLLITVILTVLLMFFLMNMNNNNNNPRNDNQNVTSFERIKMPQEDSVQSSKKNHATIKATNSVPAPKHEPKPLPKSKPKPEKKAKTYFAKNESKGNGGGITIVGANSSNGRDVVDIAREQEEKRRNATKPKDPDLMEIPPGSEFRESSIARNKNNYGKDGHFFIPPATEVGRFSPEPEVDHVRVTVHNTSFARDVVETAKRQAKKTVQKVKREFELPRCSCRSRW